MNLNGKTVVVIGAGSGIGRAVAVDAANAGATLILGGCTAAPLKETARLAGGTVRVVDASREEDVQAFFESIGSVDHLVRTIRARGAGPINQQRADGTPTATEAQVLAAIFLVKDRWPPHGPRH